MSDFFTDARKHVGRKTIKQFFYNEKWLCYHGLVADFDAQALSGMVLAVTSMQRLPMRVRTKMKIQFKSHSKLAGLVAGLFLSPTGKVAATSIPAAVLVTALVTSPVPEGTPVSAAPPPSEPAAAGSAPPALETATLIEPVLADSAEPEPAPTMMAMAGSSMAVVNAAVIEDGADAYLLPVSGGRAGRYRALQPTSAPAQPASVPEQPAPLPSADEPTPKPDTCELPKIKQNKDGIVSCVLPEDKETTGGPCELPEIEQNKDGIVSCVLPEDKETTGGPCELPEIEQNKDGIVSCVLPEDKKTTGGPGTDDAGGPEAGAGGSGTGDAGGPGTDSEGSPDTNNPPQVPLIEPAVFAALPVAAAIPVPATWALLGVGLLGLGWSRRRNK